MAVPYTTRVEAKRLARLEVKKVIIEENLPTMNDVNEAINEAITGAINASY